jgi:hypothetical protein
MFVDGSRKEKRKLKWQVRNVKDQVVMSHFANEIHVFFPFCSACPPRIFALQSRMDGVSFKPIPRDKWHVICASVVFVRFLLARAGVERNVK